MIGVRLAVLCAAVFAPLGVMLPFWPVYLESKGCDDTAIGLLLGVPIWIRCLAVPLLAGYVDRSGRRREMIIALGVSGLLCFLPLRGATSFSALLLWSVLFYGLYTSLIPLLDNTIVIASRAGAPSYGVVRAFGSVAFLSMALGTGALLESPPTWLPPDQVVFWMMAGALAAIAVTSFGVPRIAGRTGSDRTPISTLLREPRFRLLLVVASLVQASHAAYYAFSTLHWRRSGISSELISVLWAEGVVVEIALFLVGARLVAMLGPRKLLLIGALAAAVRWLGTGVTTELPALVALQAMHALSFGATHLGAVAWIGGSVSDDRSATAQSVMSSTVGLGTAALTAACGPIFESGGPVVFPLMAGVALLGGGAVAWLGHVERRVRTGSVESTRE